MTSNRILLIVLIGVLITYIEEEWIYNKLFGGEHITSSHKDKSRSSVGWTAMAVSMLRAVESTNNKLIVDDVALKLFEFCEILCFSKSIIFAIKTSSFSSAIKV